MYRTLAALAGAACLLASAAIPARSNEERAPAEPPFVFGVGTHFAFPLERRYLPGTVGPQLEELGVDSFRDDVNADFYVAPSPLRPLGTRGGRLAEALESRWATPVLIMRGRTLEQAPKPRLAPRTDGERGQFEDFASSLVRTTRPFSPIYEIWNEWNMQWRERPRLKGLIPGRENPDYSPENYVAAAKAAYRGVKSANRDALVLTGSIGEDEGWTWTRRALRAGLAQTGDGISVHFYNHCTTPAKRTAEDLVERTQDFRRVVTEEAGEDAPPLYITEFGWPNDNGACGIDRDLAAVNIAQYTLWSATVDWVRGVWVYELRDSGLRPDEREDNFGLYDYENRPKPAACAYREAIALSREIGGGRFREAGDGVRWLEGSASDGSPVWVFWASERDGRATLRLPQEAGAAPGRVLCSGERAGVSGTERPVGPMPLVVRPPAGTSPQAVSIERG